MRAPLLLLSVAVIIGSAETAAAQCVGPQLNPRRGLDDIGVYFDESATMTCLDLDSDMPFRFYVIGAGGSGAGIAGYEFAVEIDPRIQVLARTLPASALDVDNREDSYEVGLTGGACLSAPLNTLVTYEAVLTEPRLSTDVTICIVPHSPPGLPCGIGFVGCLGPIEEFDPAYKGCAVINPVELEQPISNPRSSWGTVKALFSD